jgi:CO/xanthine dehydrogenase Mo-binding subunit
MNAFSGKRRYGVSDRDLQIVGRDFSRKDGVARVTGQERYTCRWQLQGVATENARSECILWSTVVGHA